MIFYDNSSRFITDSDFFNMLYHLLYDTAFPLDESYSVPSVMPKLLAGGYQSWKSLNYRLSKYTNPFVDFNSASSDSNTRNPFENNSRRSSSGAIRLNPNPFLSRIERKIKNRQSMPAIPTYQTNFHNNMLKRYSFISETTSDNTSSFASDLDLCENGNIDSINPFSPSKLYDRRILDEEDYQMQLKEYEQTFQTNEILNLYAEPSLQIPQSPLRRLSFVNENDTDPVAGPIDSTESNESVSTLAITSSVNDLMAIDKEPIISIVSLAESTSDEEEVMSEHAEIQSISSEGENESLIENGFDSRDGCSTIDSEELSIPNETAQHEYHELTDTNDVTSGGKVSIDGKECTHIEFSNENTIVFDKTAKNEILLSEHSNGEIDLADSKFDKVSAKEVNNGITDDDGDELTVGSENSQESSNEDVTHLPLRGSNTNSETVSVNAEEFASANSVEIVMDTSLSEDKTTLEVTVPSSAINDHDTRQPCVNCDTDIQMYQNEIVNLKQELAAMNLMAQTFRSQTIQMKILKEAAEARFDKLAKVAHRRLVRAISEQ
ncbi:hypothetical protein BC833DRAFT_261233 [Globomyces pollinis-pini]|nr:hypothetical protein BC833DRAFT_261233 [Globomyces pollinis-pini]